MNRIRQIDKNKFQILSTPHREFDYNIEYLLSNWTDFNLKNYKIIEVSTMSEALDISYQYPNIDWEKMVLHHVEIFKNLRNLLTSILKNINVNCHLKSVLVDPLQLKNIMFDRVQNYGERFSLGENLNDIINFKITSVYTQNLEHIRNVLQNESRLRIKHVVSGESLTNIICQTDIGSYYNIVLITNLIDENIRWGAINEKKRNFNSILKQQKLLDAKFEFN